MKTARILVIDDDASVTRGIRMNLEALGGYEVRTEHHARAALDAARAFRPDLILLDVMMPELDGGELAAQLQQDVTLAVTPIVFLTAIVSKHETSGREACIGGQRYLAKPVDVATLIRVIESHLHRAPSATPA